jgi:integrase
LAARHALRPASVIAYRQIERHLAPWMTLALPAITAEMVEARHRSLANEIGPVTANMAMRVLRIVWNFAAERAPLPPNPVTRLKRQWFAQKRRKGRVQDHDLPTFFAAVQALPSRTAADYVLMLLFTGMRKKETASLRWTDVDLAGKTITVRAEETKAGRELQLPMSDFVFDLLVRRRALGSASPYVFPGSGETGHVVNQ